MVDPRLSIGEEELRSLFRVDDFLAACDRAFRLHGQGVLLNSPRLEVIEKQRGLGYFRLEMAARWPGRYRACKIIEEWSDVGRGRLETRTASLTLKDLRRDRAVSMEADYLTDMRTGAAGALGLKYLAPLPVRRVGLVGTGRIARALAPALDRLFDLEEIGVTSRSARNREKFALAMEKRLRASLNLADSIETCIDGADAVIAAVPTPRPIFSVEALEGIPCLVVLGGDGRTRQLPQEVMEQREVVVDELGQARQSGEFKHALAAGRFEPISFARDEAGRILNVGDAACGRLQPRTEVPRLVYLTGLAVQDLCAAIGIYEKLVAGQGAQVTSEQP